MRTWAQYEKDRFGTVMPTSKVAIMYQIGEIEKFLGIRPFEPYTRVGDKLYNEAHKNQ
jgi:hypothetical protein